MNTRVVLVTGAASGIGRASAARFAREGWNVLLGDRTDPEPAAAEIRAAGGNASAAIADVSDETQVQALVARTLEAYGRLDALVSAAGVSARAPLVEMDLADAERILDVNLKGTFLCCKHAVPAIRAGGGGAVVTIGSELAFAGTPRISMYSASKAAVVQLTRCLAVEHARDNVRANCVCPGPVETPMLMGGIGLHPDPGARRRTIEDATLLGRIGQPEEIANVIHFLASDEASYMTGAVVLVDGGVTAT